MCDRDAGLLVVARLFSVDSAVARLPVVGLQEREHVFTESHCSVFLRRHFRRIAR